VCRSDALREVRLETVDHALVHCLVRCGECETWRAAFATWPAGRRLERRFQRKGRRDRRRIARSARAGWPTDVALEMWLSGSEAVPSAASAGMERVANDPDAVEPAA